MSKIWIVDDDQSIRWVLDRALQKVNLYARFFERAEDLLPALATDKPDVLMTDIRMGGMSGLELLKKVKTQCPNIVVIVMTAFTDLDSTVTAFQDGAFDYLPKPFDINEAITLIRRACEHSAALSYEPPEEKQEVRPQPEFKRMMTQSHSKTMQEVFRAIGRLAPSKVTVLITGESGSGKELIARAVHEHGSRAHKPFVAINAAAIPKDLLEAELFGHERGAFTGATQLRKGRFEEANGGTLFLDEIGDMPLDLQTRLLRVLAEGSFYRIGGTQAVHVDVRIIAATHQPLETRVEQGVFREDLFHRLNVIRLRIPPLRERKDDIPQLCQYFLQMSAASLGVQAKLLTPDVVDVLKGFDYPGNVRQLENFCHWLTVMSPVAVITLDDLPPELLESLNSQVSIPSMDVVNQPALATVAVEHSEPIMVRSSMTWTEGLREEVLRRLSANEAHVMDDLYKVFEKVVLEAALEECRGRKIEAATRLGIGRNTVTRKLKELGIS